MKQGNVSFDTSPTNEENTQRMCNGLENIRGVRQRAMIRTALQLVVEHASSWYLDDDIHISSNCVISQKSHLSLSKQLGAERSPTIFSCLEAVGSLDGYA